MSPHQFDARAVALLDARPVLADLATDRWFALRPEYDERYGQRGRERCTEDGVRHLTYLAAAIRVAEPAVFVEYITWAQVLLDGLGIPSDDLAGHLQQLRLAAAEVSPDVAEAMGPALAAGLDVLSRPVVIPEPFVRQSSQSELAGAFVEALVTGARLEAAEAIEAAVDVGLSIEDLYLEVFQPALREIGRMWQIGAISVAEEHLATATTQLIMSQLYPRIFDLPATGRGTMIAACVSGNLHEVGVRMVADVFRLRGWDTHLLGASMPTGSVVDLAVARKADLVAVSVMLVEQFDQLEEIIAELRERTEAIILVGGAPFHQTPGLAQLLGADGTAVDARQAVELAERLIATRAGA